MNHKNDYPKKNENEKDLKRKAKPEKKVTKVHFQDSILVGQMRIIKKRTDELMSSSTMSYKPFMTYCFSAQLLDKV